jgi:hypothetical protein
MDDIASRYEMISILDDDGSLFTPGAAWFRISGDQLSRDTSNR